MTESTVVVLSTTAAGLAAGVALVVGVPTSWGLAMAIGYALAAAALVYLTMRVPEAVFALFLLSSFMKAAVGVVDLTVVTGALTAAGTLLQIRKLGARPTPRATWLFVVLAALLAAGVLGTPSFAYGMDKTLRFATLALMTVFATPQLLRDRKSTGRFALALALVATLGAVLAVAAGPDPTNYGRFTAFGSNTLALGEVMALGLVSWTALGVCRIVRWPLALLGGFLCTWALIGSGNRASLLGALLAEAALVVGIVVTRATATWSTRADRPAEARPKQSKLWLRVGAWLAAAMCVALVASAVWATTPAVSQKRYIGLIQGRQDKSTMERQYMYAAGMAMFQRNPIFGAGTGAFATATPVHWYPHNPALELLAENGIIAGGLYVALIVYAVFMAAKYLLRSVSLQSALALTGLLGMLPVVMSSSDVNGYRIFYAFVALAMTLPLTDREQLADRSTPGQQRSAAAPSKTTS